MRKFINWASILFVVLLVYAMLSECIDVLPKFPFGDLDIFPSLLGIAIAIYGIDYLNSKKFINLVFNGDITNLPFVMEALERYDKRMYNIIMEDYSNELILKIDTLKAHIEDEKFRFIDKLQRHQNASFDIKDELKNLYGFENTAKMLNEVKKGKITWNDIQNDCIKEQCMIYAAKFLLSDIDESEKERILKMVETIKNMMDGDLTVQLN